jgi:hypothetical protein
MEVLDERLPPGVQDGDPPEFAPEVPRIVPEGRQGLRGRSIEVLMKDLRLPGGWGAGTPQTRSAWGTGGGGRGLEIPARREGRRNGGTRGRTQMRNDGQSRLPRAEMAHALRGFRLTR